LLIVAFICFALSAVTIRVHPRIDLVALGLALWVLTLLLS
jgi:hypothetical protein